MMLWWSHQVGLMHNFKASVRPEEGHHSDSVMDYLPRTERSVYPIKVGRYDIDAINWGYYGNPLTTASTRYDLYSRTCQKMFATSMVLKVTLSTTR